MDYIFITNNPAVAAHAQRAGVARVMVDLEQIGKHERQGHLDTLISSHQIDDIAKVRDVITCSRLQVRVNPIGEGSETEIDSVISRGADIVMLPMFTTGREVSEFVSFVDGRAAVCLLLETPQALIRIDEILSIEGVDEVHIGLNDLHLGLKLDFMFELLISPILESLVATLSQGGIPYGVGGIARFGTGLVDPKLVLSRLFHLGASIVFLSRSFHDNAQSIEDISKKFDLESAVSDVTNYLDTLKHAGDKTIEQNKTELMQQVSVVVSRGRAD